MHNSKHLSNTRIQRLRAQGYTQYSSAEITELAYGNRFAYRICTVLLGLALVFNSVPILSGMLAISILGFLLDNHPFDYIYNLFLAKRMGKPRLPKRSEQLKFACTLASLWIGLTILSINGGEQEIATYLGGSLFGVAALAATTDICIPSIVYNTIYAENTNHQSA